MTPTEHPAPPPAESSLVPSPLHDRHAALGAKWAAFGGWSMPLEYPTGITAEHVAVRSRVGLFDVSHLGTLLVRGPGATSYLNDILSADLGGLRDGRAQYTLLCAEDGDVVDDLIAYRTSVDDVVLVPNAANSAQVVARIQAAAPDDVAIIDRHRETAILAVQGPASAEVLAAVGLPSTMEYMSFIAATWNAPGGATDHSPTSVVVCRTGYTGEHGYELMVAADVAVALWDVLVEAVQAAGGAVCGLGARDTLRTEMGYPLHGQDLGHGITPLHARLAWAVAWDKPHFDGREALMALRAAGADARLWGLRSRVRAVPRPGMSVTDDAGAVLGTVTSGTFSPTLQTGIALALLQPGVDPGDLVMLDVRGRQVPMEVVRPPFIDARPA